MTKSVKTSFLEENFIRHMWRVANGLDNAGLVRSFYTCNVVFWISERRLSLTQVWTQPVSSPSWRAKAWWPTLSRLLKWVTKNPVLTGLHGKRSIFSESSSKSIIRWDFSSPYAAIENFVQTKKYTVYVVYLRWQVLDIKKDM